MRFIKRVVASIMLTTLMISNYGVITASAVDTILGVPISKFDNVNKFKTRVEKSITDLDTYGTKFYEMRYMFDSYGYAYYILELSELLGVQTSSIEEHIVTYNGSIRKPLSEGDEIKSTGSSDDLVIASNSADYKKKMESLIGTTADTGKDDSKTLFSMLGNLRVRAGLSAKHNMSQNWKDSSLTEEELKVFVTENITETRVLLTVTKDIVDNFIPVLDYDLMNTLSAYFVETYDVFMQFALEKDIEGLKDLDLFFDEDSKVFDPNSPDSKKDIGKWDDTGKEPILTDLSEYMLKGIAASATFKPFETNLNSTGAFSFVGDNMKLFHETYGVKRKFLLTPSDAFRNVNVGLDISQSKEIKIITLRDFVSDQGKDKVLYVDNIDYDIGTVEDTQEKLNTKKEDEDGDEAVGSGTEDDKAVDDIVDETLKDKNTTWYANPIRTTQNIASYYNQNILYDFLIPDALVGGMSSKEGYVDSVIFASGDMTGLGFYSRLNSEVESQLSKVNVASVLYTNIMEEYYNSTLNGLNFKADLDKPMYVDVYGNILTASGYVVIPAMSNPFLFNDKEGIWTFTRAFIESYPEFVLEKGKISPSKKDKKKKAFGVHPTKVTTSDGFFDREEETGDVDLDGAGNKTEDEVIQAQKEKINAFTTSLEGQPTKELGFPDTTMYVAKASNIQLFNKLSIVEGVDSIVDRFDAEYKLEKSLDIYGFAQKDTFKITGYKDIADGMKFLKPSERVAVINDFTVKLNQSESGTSDIVTFKDIPNSEEVKRYLYLTSLARLIKIDNGEVLDKNTISASGLRIVKQLYYNGIYGLEDLNNRITPKIASVYEDYEQFILDKSNNRYQNLLGANSSNSLLYNAPLEETNGMKKIVPVLYKIILMVAILSIIVLIILSVFSKEGKLKQALRAFYAIYLIMFLLQVGPWFFDTLVNRPVSWLMNSDLTSWTVIEQENNLNKIKVIGDGEAINTEVEKGSEIKLYQLDYTYPFKLFKGNDVDGLLSIDEHYATFIDSDAFKEQNNDMWVDGRYIVTDTNTLFSSSSIIVNNPKDDVLQKLTHEVYKEPELSYYLPYYMFLDNMVYNLNIVTNLTRKIPTDVAYRDGNISTTGRVRDYMGSALFLDYEEFSKRIEQYVGSDSIDTELAKEEVKSAVDQYGEYEDFLGIRKIIHTNEGYNMEPFDDDEGLERIKNTAWYPNMDYETMTPSEKENVQDKIEKINKKTKRFMLSLYEGSDRMSDESLIKTIALFASFEFNKEFGKYASNSYLPTGLSTKSITAERIMIALSVPKEDMLDVSLKSYPLIIIEKMGYLGMLLSTFNDVLIMAINYIKPGLSVVVWCVTAVVVFTRKILLPDKNNSSVMGGLKVLIHFSLSSLAYAISLWVIVRLINLGLNLWICHALLAVFNLGYVFLLGVIVVALIRDTANLGNAYLLQGANKSLSLAQAITQGVLDSTPLGRKLMYGNARKREGTNRLMQRMEGKLGRELDEKTKSLVMTSGSIDVKNTISSIGSSMGRGVSTGKRMSKDTMRKSSSYIAGRATQSKDSFNNYVDGKLSPVDEMNQSLNQQNNDGKEYTEETRTNHFTRTEEKGNNNVVTKTTTTTTSPTASSPKVVNGRRVVLRRETPNVTSQTVDSGGGTSTGNRRDNSPKPERETVANTNN